MRFSTIASFVCLILINVSAQAQFAFGKRAPEEKIQALLGLSISKKIERIQAEGILVRHVEFKNPQMRGQFLSPAQYPGLQSPEIRLSAIADDWTVVHEYIHALMSSDTPKRISITRQEYESALQDQEKSGLSLEENLKLFVVINSYKLEQMHKFDFEEMAIEFYLREVYFKQKPKNFTPAAVEVSRRYIMLSGLQALNELLDIKKACTELSANYQRAGKPLPASANNICLSAKINTREVVGILSASGIPEYEHLAE
jgi:hypothetical protein